MRKITFLLTLLISATALIANSSYREIYIEQYKEIAISEMHRVGIPASIKLAQAILESNAGKSTLAIAANNHFGIKCGSRWKGKTFYRKDDDRNKRGKLIKSCFRSFDNPVESFMEHSDFLSIQNRKRYDFLFNYSTSDYANWAYGLKKAGYATDPQYARRLIKIIEDFQLYKYDNPGGLNDILVTTPVFEQGPEQDYPRKQKYREPNVFADGSAGEISMDLFKSQTITQETNGVQYTIAQSGDNIGQVAIQARVPVRKLVKFNDGIDSYNQRLESGQKIYLAKKKTKYKGKKKFHYVNAEDDMVGISQEYGIQLHALYAMNAMPLGTEPAIGEKIRLKGKTRKGNSIQTRMLRIENEVLESLPSEKLISETKPLSNQDIQKEKFESASEIFNSSIQIDNPIEEETIVHKINRPDKMEAPIEKVENTKPKIIIDTPIESSSEVVYVVAKGDTLWNISQRFGTNVATLKDMNSLNSNTIHVGQKLRIK